MTTTTNSQNRLRERRIAKGLSQIGLAAAAGVSISTVSRAERWGFDVSESTAKRLASALQCRVEDIFPRVEDVNAHLNCLTHRRAG
ncbi:MAG: helix-turn-helix transcriptional regulator [Verrucomicrobiia bacterium]